MIRVNFDYNDRKHKNIKHVRIIIIESITFLMNTFCLCLYKPFDSKLILFFYRFVVSFRVNVNPFQEQRPYLSCSFVLFDRKNKLY